MTTTGDKLKSLLGDAAMNFLSNVIQAKQNGEPLPKALDKVASIAIQGENKAIEIAKKEAKEQTIKNMSWVIVGVLVLVIVVILVKKS